MTPTAQKGIVMNKVYRIKTIPNRGDTSSAGEEGMLVKLKRDDGSTLPYFSVTNESGSLDGEQVIINVNSVVLEDFGLTEATDYSIKVENGVTTLVFQKSLTVNQIHDVLAAAGL